MANSNPRYLDDSIGQLALQRQKMAFVSGPRQVGKTTLGREALTQRGGGAYFTWDDVAMRRLWTKDPSALIKLWGPQGLAGRIASRQVRPLFVFDEVHKARGWKNTIKGLYDLHSAKCDLFVTGSARLNVYRRGGDSLLGRYLHFRLHPFSVGELLGGKTASPDEFLRALMNTERPKPEPAVGKPSSEAEGALASLFRFGGFPEPLFAQSTKVWNLWRRNRLEKVIREDLRDLSRIPDLSRIEMLASLLPERVGSLLSVQSLREDLEVAHDTVRRWLDALDELYYLYEIKPYATSIARSIRKEGKLYLWDWSEVEAEGPRFENLVAGHIAKACAFWTDTGEGVFELAFLRDKEKHEVDFLIVRDKKPWLAVETKTSDVTPTRDFARFRKYLGPIPCVQIVKRPITPRYADGVLVASASAVLSLLP